MGFILKPILIVDDEPDICWALNRIVQGMGFQTFEVFSGEKAIQICKETTVGMAFIDAKLQDIEGIDLCIKLKELQPTMPMVLISGYFDSSSPQIQQWLKEGLIVGFIGKPFLHQQIHDIINNQQ